ncbi:MAG TPA: phosphoribosylanthranilate isomerase [Hyphomicrobiaceae bacterium]|nr:phosphoribosylanthranilate isomerase [Hyphomicrobiaceae bacterium]
MATKVKICGLKSAAAVEAALAGGADYVGFVFYPPSPRSIAPDRAAEIAKPARGRAKIVALFVDPDDRLLEHVVSVLAPDIIQLHGRETPERVAAIRARFKRPVMKAIKVETAADAAQALRYKAAADLIVFDAKAPKDWADALPGGNGVPFDWHALDEVKDKVEYMLSGGLTPANVAQSISLTGAAAVDVSSGVEARPGEKDVHLIADFLAAAKAAS